MSHRSAEHGAHFAEFPTTVEAAQACRDHGIKVMMGAPNLIRGGSHSGNVAAEGSGRRRGFWTSCRRTMCPHRCCRRALMLGDIWGDVARGVATVTTAPADCYGACRPRSACAPALRADVIRVARIGRAAALRGVWVAGQRVG
jgi:alpha-D-ribose 1-methylphosphonate 5-triphosphate diphosphatase